MGTGEEATGQCSPTVPWNLRKEKIEDINCIEVYAAMILVCTI